MSLVELATGRRFELDHATERPRLCDAGDRLLGFSDDGPYAIELANGAFVRERIDEAEQLRRIATCRRRSRIYQVGDGVFAWTGATSAPRKVAVAGGAMALMVTDDGAHALVDRATKLVRWNMTGEVDGIVNRSIGVKFAASRDGAIVALGGQKPEVCDLVKGTRTAIAAEAPISSIAMTPDARRIVYASGGRVWVAATDGTIERRLDGIGEWSRVAVRDDGTWAVAVGKELLLWNLDAPEPLVLDGTGNVKDAHFDGAFLVALDLDGRIRRWPLVAPTPALPWIFGAAWSPDGSVAVRATQERVAREIGGAHTEVDMPPGVDPVRIAIAATGDVAITRPEGVWRWTRDDKHIFYGTHGGRTRWPAGLHVGWANGEIVSWDEESLVIWHRAGLIEIPVQPQVASVSNALHVSSALAISPSGAWAAGTRPIRAHRAHGRSVELFDLARGAAHQLPNSRAHQAAFSPDNTSLATGDIGGGIVLWDVATRQPRSMRGTGTAHAASAAFSPAGDRVALAGVGDILLADVARGTTDVLASSTASARLIAFGDGIVAVGYDDHILVVDLATRESWTRPLAPVAIAIVPAGIAVATLYTTVTLGDRVPRDRDALLAWLAAGERSRRPGS